MQKGYPSQTAHVNISNNTIHRTTARQTRPAARCSAAGEYVASGSGEDTHPMGSASISGYSAVCGAVSGAPNAPPPTVVRTVSFAAIQGWRRVRRVRVMGCKKSAGRFAPCARQSPRNSIQDRARRSKRHQKPEKNAKYVAVYGNHSMRQGLTDNFRRWHIADLYACPYVQSLARTPDIVMI